MTYKLKFEKELGENGKKLGHPVKEQFKKKLAERLENPRVPSAKLSGHAIVIKLNCARWVSAGLSSS